MAADEEHRIETKESWLKLDSPVSISLLDGTKLTLDLLRLVQVVRYVNTDDSVAAVIHHEVHPVLNRAASEIKLELDTKIEEKQLEIEKLNAEKAMIDAAETVGGAGGQP